MSLIHIPFHSLCWTVNQHNTTVLGVSIDCVDTYIFISRHSSYTFMEFNWIIIQFENLTVVCLYFFINILYSVYKCCVVYSMLTLHIIPTGSENKCIICASLHCSSHNWSVTKYKTTAWKLLFMFPRGTKNCIQLQNIWIIIYNPNMLKLDAKRAAESVPWERTETLTWMFRSAPFFISSFTMWWWPFSVATWRQVRPVGRHSLVGHLDEPLKVFSGTGRSSQRFKKWFWELVNKSVLVQKRQTNKSTSLFPYFGKDYAHHHKKDFLKCRQQII